MGRFPRVTHPSAAPSEKGARLACVKPAASVRSEPGSNSHVEEIDVWHIWSRFELTRTFTPGQTIIKTIRPGRLIL